MRSHSRMYPFTREFLTTCVKQRQLFSCVKYTLYVELYVMVYLQFVAVTYKAVSSRFARLSVRYHHRFIDVAESLEVLAERRVRGVVRQTADKDLRESRVFLNAGIHRFQRPVHELMQKHIGAQSVDTKRAASL